MLNNVGTLTISRLTFLGTAIELDSSSCCGIGGLSNGIDGTIKVNYAGGRGIFFGGSEDTLFNSGSGVIDILDPTIAGIVLTNGFLLNEGEITIDDEIPACSWGDFRKACVPQLLQSPFLIAREGW